MEQEHLEMDDRACNVLHDKRYELGSMLPTPIMAIKQSICYSCFTPASEKPLSKCAACKQVAYCSSRCQKASWNDGHKQACKILVKRNNLKPKADRGTLNWKAYRDRKTLEMKALTTQHPDYCEEDMRLLSYDQYCCHCYRCSTQLNNDEKFKNCATCLITSYCSSCPQTHDPDTCTKLLEIVRAENFLIEHHKMTGQNFLPLPTQQPREEYLPLSTAMEWYDYYSQISDKQLMCGVLARTWDTCDVDKPRDPGQVGIFRCASVTGSMALTVLAALEVAFTDIGLRTSLKLHFVGVTSRELEGLMMFEELLHLLPSLEKLELTFVGPSGVLKLTTPGEAMKLECCPSCTSAGRTRDLELWHGKYHDFVKTKIYKKPDLAVAFHTGFSMEEQESWTPTINFLAKAQHPTVFTSYNVNEARGETAILELMGANFLWGPEVNKWKGMVPLLEAAEDMENSFYYVNYYWYIIGPKD